MVVWKDVVRRRNVRGRSPIIKHHDASLIDKAAVLRSTITQVGEVAILSCLRPKVAVTVSTPDDIDRVVRVIWKFGQHIHHRRRGQESTVALGEQNGFVNSRQGANKYRTSPSGFVLPAHSLGDLGWRMPVGRHGNASYREALLGVCRRASSSGKSSLAPRRGLSVRTRLELRTVLGDRKSVV